MQSRSANPSTPSFEQQQQQLPFRRETPSSRTSSVSLAAAASINATEISRRNSNTGDTRGSPRPGRVSERRRSQVAMNIALNDPSIPTPCELSSNDHRSSLSHGLGFVATSPTGLGGSHSLATGDPHHHRPRAPSLGEIHQELEEEQEAQVNRLLQMIRTQQLQLEQMQRYQADHNSRQSSQVPTTASAGNNHQGNGSAALVEESTPTSERSFSLVSATGPFPPLPQSFPRPMRRLSRGSSTTSPALRPVMNRQRSQNSLSGDHGPPSPFEIVRRNSSRDDSAYFQAETATLARENQMLRIRIRELERQLSELNPSTQANSPSVPSNLGPSPPTVEAQALSSAALAHEDTEKE